MAGIDAPMRDILARLTTLKVVNQNQMEVDLFSRVWNNQIDKIVEGNSQYMPWPAAFLEVVPDAGFSQIGQGYVQSDPVFRLHLVHENIDNSLDGSQQQPAFEQDLEIFALRNRIIALLSGYTPTGCGPLVKAGEEQDFDHTNVYHYILDFTAAFIDGSGSIDTNGDFITKDPPTEVEITVNIDKSGDNQITEKDYLIPPIPYRTHGT